VKTQWHYSPAHLFIPGSIYIITAGTLYKAHFFASDNRLQLLQDLLLETVRKCGWTLHAWAVFTNHYHMIVCAPKTESSLEAVIKELHSKTALAVNELDRVCGRQVWYQYWDTCLTYEKSWLARLNYVNNNAVHHGLAKTAINYPYCSAAWLEQTASPAFNRTVRSFKYDRVRVFDEAAASCRTPKKIGSRLSVPAADFSNH